MKVTEFLEYLRNDGFTIKTDGNFLDVTPSRKLSPDILDELRKYKRELIHELQFEGRAEKVKEMLKSSPTLKRAITADTEIDPNNVIVTLGIRDCATVELFINKAKFEPFEMLIFLDNLDKSTNINH